MKKLFIRVALVLALSLAVTQPIALTQTSQVAKAETKLYSRKEINKKYSKLECDLTLKKVKKILGKSLGKKQALGKIGKKVITKYKVRFYLEKSTVNCMGYYRNMNIPKYGYTEIYVIFHGNSLFDWGRETKEWYVDENGNPIDDPVAYYDL